MPPPPPRAGPPRMVPPLSMFPPPLNPNILSAPPTMNPRQKPPPSSASGESSILAPPSISIRPPSMQLPPPPGTVPASANPPTHTIEKRANITSVAGSAGQPGAATISAKPQIINPKAEVTRFVPTALRVRRDRPGPQAPPPAERGHKREEERGHRVKAMPMANPAMGHMGTSSVPPNMKTKDQMYEAFMREMEGLL